VLGEGVEGGRDAAPAFVQRYVAPGAVLVETGPYGLPGGAGVEAWRTGDRGAVDGAGGGQGPAVGLPGGVPEVEDTVVPERLGGHGEATLPGVGPGRVGFEGEGGCHSVCSALGAQSGAGA
jgi:hypothetical protein